MIESLEGGTRLKLLVLLLWSCLDFFYKHANSFLKDNFYSYHFPLLLAKLNTCIFIWQLHCLLCLVRCCEGNGNSEQAEKITEFL